MPPEIKPPNNQEIEQALREFKRSGVMPQPQTDKIPTVPDNVPKMVRMVMRLSGGAIKEQKQAEYVLLGFVIVSVAVSILLFFGAENNNTEVKTSPPGYKVIYPDDAPPKLEPL